MTNSQERSAMKHFFSASTILHQRSDSESFVLDEFLRNFSDYSAQYLQMDRAPLLTDNLYQIGRQVREGERSWTKHDLLDIIAWKRLYALRKWITEDKRELELHLNENLKIEDDDERIDSLCSGSGFGPVLASAILTLTWPEEYGFLDYHSWKALRSLGFDLTGRPFSGGGYSIPEYLHFLAIIRRLSDQVPSFPAKVADALYAFDNVRRKHQRI
jgi:hypothetical protein